jgi:hypothetical protein
MNKKAAEPKEPPSTPSTSAPDVDPANDSLPDQGPSIVGTFFFAPQEKKTKETVLAYTGDSPWPVIATWAESHADRAPFVSDTEIFELEVLGPKGKTTFTATVRKYVHD